MRDESAGALWWIRAPLLLPLALFLVGHVRDMGYSSIVSGINLVIHEGGHLFFMWFGIDALTVLGGTLFQVGVPACVAALFFRQKDHFGVAIACFWVGLGLAQVAPYAADARSQLLPLVSPFPGAPTHDWNYLLGHAGLLEQDTLVATAFHHGGILVMALSLALAIWLLRGMAESAQGVGSEETGQPTSQVGGSSVSSLNTRR